MINPIKTLKLLLPALIPAWNFFDIIAPSPRVYYAISPTPEEARDNWQEFRPRTETLPLWRILARLWWNPRWNESLFVMSCAERLMENPTRHSEDEILHRIARDLAQQRTDNTQVGWLQFRLITIERQGETLQQTLVYESRPFDLSAYQVKGELP